MYYFDSHTHYNDRRFREDLGEVLGKVRAAGVLRDTIIGYDPESSLLAVRMAEEQRSSGDEKDSSSAGPDAAYPKDAPLHTAAIGIHPLHTGDAEEEDLIRMEILAEDPAVVAIGEIGLDYYRKTPDMIIDKERQQYFFRKQIRIARRAGLPVVIHSRNAAQDTIELMEEEKALEVGGVIHCFTYSSEMAKRFVGMGFCLGIGGVLTYPASKKLKEVAGCIPLEHLVLETDCPYLSPEGHRGERNDSGGLKAVARALAELRGIPVEEVCRITWENACRLYRIEGAAYPEGS